MGEEGEHHPQAQREWIKVQVVCIFLSVWLKINCYSLYIVYKPIITAESHPMIFCSISDLKGVDLFRLDEGAKEDEAMVLVDMKGREVGIEQNIFKMASMLNFLSGFNYLALVTL